MDPVKSPSNAEPAQGSEPLVRKKRGPRLKSPRHLRSLLAKEMRAILRDSSLTGERRTRLVLACARELGKAIEQETNVRLDELEKLVAQALGSKR